MSMSTRPSATVAPNIREHMLATYQTLRRLLAIGAILLLMLAGYVYFFESNLTLQSISALYHHQGKYFLVNAAFIGLLSMMGALLVAYSGYTAGENRLLDIAGLALIVVANCPMDPPPSTWDTLSFMGKAHIIAAVVFFACISIVMAFYAKNTLPLMRKDWAWRNVFRNLYAAYGTIMFLMILLSVGLYLMKWPVVILFAECAGVLVFGLYWMTKSREMSMGLLETVEGLRGLPEDKPSK